MKKLIFSICSVIMAIFVFLPVQAQIDDELPASPAEGFIGVDRRPMVPGSLGDRFSNKPLSQTFTSKITYKASKLDDATSSRIIAGEQAKRNLIEQITDEVEAYYELEISAKYDFDSIERDDIACFLPSLVNFNTTQDKWKNNQLKLKVEASVNAGDIINQAIVLYSKKPLANHMMINRKLADKAYDEVKKIKKDFMASGDNATTQKIYNSAVNQLSATDWFDKGLAFGFAKENQSAINAFAKAIELYPTYAEAYYYRGMYAYSLEKDHQKAILDFNKAIELKDSDASFYGSRGFCHNESDNTELALEDFDRGIELNPSLTALWMARGAVYERMDNPQKALENYTRAIEIDPEHFLPYYRIGLIHKQDKNYKQCIIDFGNVIKINDQIADAFYERAMAYAYLGNDDNKDKVIRDFQAAAKLGHSGAQDVLKSINVEW